ncbi:hypothetical protein WQE_04517 [Paraburkholderia hospita]|uniref:Secreted protein n=1 Tax=Paraburkholderia hospita TaxID=169430 RepID=A0ABN0FTZ6_9BURK|nr:hypothetical protein WQE_04517 [Paraburkholderia hospita]
MRVVAMFACPSHSWSFAQSATRSSALLAGVAPSLCTPKLLIAIFAGAAQATAGNIGRRSPQSG